MPDDKAITITLDAFDAAILMELLAEFQKEKANSTDLKNFSDCMIAGIIEAKIESQLDFVFSKDYAELLLKARQAIVAQYKIYPQASPTEYAKR